MFKIQRRNVAIRRALKAGKAIPKAYRKPKKKKEEINPDKIGVGQNPTIFGLLTIVDHFLDVKSLPYAVRTNTSPLTWPNWYPNMPFDKQFDVLSLFNGRLEPQYRRSKTRRILGQQEAMRKFEQFVEDLYRYMERLPLTFEHYRRLIEMLTIIAAPLLRSDYGRIVIHDRALDAGRKEEHFDAAKRVMTVRHGRIHRRPISFKKAGRIDSILPDFLRDVSVLWIDALP